MKAAPVAALCGGPRHSYSTNSAHYDGAGSVGVCQQMVGDVSGIIYSQTCATTAAYGSIADNCDALIDPYIWWNVGGAGSHTLRGAASY